MSLSTVTSTILGRKPWTAPDLTEPLLIDAGELEELGERRGSRWFAHRRYGELEQLPKVYGPLDILPNGPLTQHLDDDGERSFRAYRLHAPGTFATPEPVRKPRPVQPARVVDALDLAPSLAGRPERVMLPPGISPVAPSAIVPPKPARRGPESILRVLRSKGIECHLAATGELYATAHGGKAMASHRQLIEDARPLLTAYLAGAPLRCALAHKGEPPEAVTLAVGGAPICADHLDGKA